MEVSLLQHNRDVSPQGMDIGSIVEMVRGDQWPPGYQPVLLVQGVFEGGTRQQDLTRLSGLSAAVFKMTNPGVEGSSLAELREEARADPHTLLLYTVADSLVIVYPYELDVGYEVYLQRQFYQKAFLYGNDYYECLLGMPAVRKGKDAGRRCPLGHDAEAYYNPQAEPFLSWEIKEGCRRQSSQPRSSEGLRERKPNYKEVYMSLGEIEEWLEKNIELRHNVITMRKEYRWLTPGGGEWENFDDSAFNDVWRRLEKIKPTRDEHLRKTIDSSFPRKPAPVGWRRLYPRPGPWRHGGRRLRRVVPLRGVPAQVAGGDGGGMAGPGDGEPRGAGVHRPPGHLQDHVDERAAAAASAQLLLHAGRRWRQPQGRGAGADAVCADQL